MNPNQKQIKETTDIIQLLIGATTGTIDNFQASDKDYRSLKSSLVSVGELRSRLPQYLLQSNTLNQASKYIKDNAPNKGQNTQSEQRRLFIENSFRHVKAFLIESTGIPADKTVSIALSSKDRIKNEWEKALQRRGTDPEGAITMAKTLLESTFKQIIDAKGAEKGFSYSKETTLPVLYSMASKALDIHPTSTDDEKIKKLLGVSGSFVSALAELRNDRSDSHGGSEIYIKAEKRFAELAVNFAGIIASFFISTLEESATK